MQERYLHCHIASTTSLHSRFLAKGLLHRVQAGLDTFQEGEEGEEGEEGGVREEVRVQYDILFMVYIACK